MAEFYHQEYEGKEIYPDEEQIDTLLEKSEAVVVELNTVLKNMGEVPSKEDLEKARDLTRQVHNIHDRLKAAILEREKTLETTFNSEPKHG